MHWGPPLCAAVPSTDRPCTVLHFFIVHHSCSRSPDLRLRDGDSTAVTLRHALPCATLAPVRRRKAAFACQETEPGRRASSAPARPRHPALRSGH